MKGLIHMEAVAPNIPPPSRAELLGVADALDHVARDIPAGTLNPLLATPNDPRYRTLPEELQRGAELLRTVRPDAWLSPIGAGPLTERLFKALQLWNDLPALQAPDVNYIVPPRQLAEYLVQRCLRLEANPNEEIEALRGVLERFTAEDVYPAFLREVAKNYLARTAP